MSIRANLARMIGGSEIKADAAPQASTDLTDTDSETFWALTGSTGSARVVINERSALSLPALLRALEILTGVFAMTPIIYYRRTAEGKERVEDSPLFTLFHDRPNDVQSAFLFKEVILGDMLMAGRFATYIHRDGMFRPKALSRLNPIGVLPAQHWDRNDGLELFYDAHLPDGSNGRFGLLAFDQFASLAKSGLEYASSLGEVASQLGVSTRALQEYRYAASQAGIEQGEMDKALSQLTRRLGAAAAGAKAPSDALKQLGVDLRDAKGNIIDAGEAIPLIAEGLKNIESPAERAKILVDLFGKAGQQLAPLMEGGAAGVNGLRDAANSLGLVLSDKLINDADEAADKMAALKQVLEAKIAVAVSENASAIVELVDALGKLIDYAGKAAKAWRYFANLDWSPGAGSFSEQFGRMQRADMGPGVQLTRAPTALELQQIAANKAAQRAPVKVDQRFLGSSGGAIGAPRRRAPSMTPWGPAVSPGLSKAVGSNAFGGQGLSSFAPGGGDAGWIKSATSGYADLAELSAKVATANEAAKAQLAEMAKEHAPRLLAAVRGLAPAMDELRARAQGILDRLFPDEAEARQFQEELSILDAAMAKGALTTEDHRKAVKALRDEFTGLAEAMREALNIETVAGPSIESMVEQIADRAEVALDATRKNADATRVQVVDSFRDMAEGALREFDRLSSAIKSGGFLNILSSVIGLGLQLGGAGLFGKNVQSNINSVPGRAFGGPVMANTPYIVGERRAEMFVPSSAGRIEPNPGNARRGGGDTYNLSGNLLTPEWWAEIQKIGDEAAVRGAMGGADLVASRSQKQARQRLGRGR